MGKSAIRIVSVGLLIAYTFHVSQGRCTSMAPCSNGGECIDGENECDCSGTPFIGTRCQEDAGITMEPEYFVRYQLPATMGSTDSERITIGFATGHKSTTLMMVTDNSGRAEEYITIDVNNNGGIRVALNIGFDREELNTAIPNVDLADGELHVVSVYRSGRSLSMQVDYHAPIETVWNHLSDAADFTFDNPTNIYFGHDPFKGHSNGFNGCIFRAVFNGISPLKEMVINPQLDNVHAQPDGILKPATCHPVFPAPASYAH